ncbi:hypothetical protein HYU95_05260 [Candidatus Daviesbacteria bacterium]|nr:hypothetical protein [Candidatus Daviesbacteria bacterium]
MVELGARVDQTNGVLPVFKSIAVIGAAGQTGEFFTKTLFPVVLAIEAVVREHRWKKEADYPTVRFHDSISQMMGEDPEMVILATTNPIEKPFKEIVEGVKKPTTLILSQNGVGVVEAAEKILEGTAAAPLTLIRASLFTNVGRDQVGNVIYNAEKKRIALAAVGRRKVTEEDRTKSDKNGESKDRKKKISEEIKVEREEISREDKVNLLKVRDMFEQAGYEVIICDDFHSMEYTKLLVNLLGSTSTVTGLAPSKAFSDPEVIFWELRGLRDRLKIFKAAGIEVDSRLWNVRALEMAAKLPVSLLRAAKDLIARKIASERNDQLPSAARQVKRGEKAEEATNYYHKPIIDLGRECGIESPVDETIWEIITRHQRANNNFKLNELQSDERKKVFSEIYELETKEVFINDFAPLKWLTKVMFRALVTNFTAKGTANLKLIEETLKRGKSAQVDPEHRSHSDHGIVMEAIGRFFSETGQRFPVYIVANTKFDSEGLSGFLSRSYPRVIVQTLNERTSEEERWKAQIINRRSARITDNLLENPCIFIVYLEGSRSKIFNQEGKVQMQEPAAGSSAWLADSRFDLFVPAAIRGTEKIWPRGKGFLSLRRGDVAIEFCNPFTNAGIKELGAGMSFRKRNDRGLSGIVLSTIAARLPEDERGIYADR